MIIKTVARLAFAAACLTSNRDHPGGARGGGATDRCGEASPDSQSGRRLAVVVCAAERDRK